MKEQYHCTQLANGLQVVTVEMPHLHKACLELHLKVGGRHNPPGKSGLSHFLEHMVFRGTADYASSLEIEIAFEELGGRVNASTDTDTTCYFAHILPCHVAEGLEILSSLILRPRLDGIETERRIICEEALESISADGDEICPGTITHRMIWPDHPLGEALIGSLESIQNISEADLREHLDRWYRPNNSLLVVAGPVKHRQVVAKAESLFGSWQPAELPHGQPLPDLLPVGPLCRFVDDADSQVSLMLSFRACHRKSDDMTALGLLRYIVAGGGSSRLHLALRERLGLIYSVDASMENYDDTGCFSIAFLTAPENLPAALEATLNELELLIRQGVSQQELDRGRRLFMAELEYSKDSTSAMCSRFGMGTLLGVARSADEDQQRLKAVTLEDLQRLASQLFRSDNCFLVAVGPLAEVDQQQIRGQLQGWGMESVKQVCTCPD